MKEIKTLEKSLRQKNGELKDLSKVNGSLEDRLELLQLELEKQRGLLDEARRLQRSSSDQQPYLAGRLYENRIFHCF